MSIQAKEMAYILLALHDTLSLHSLAMYVCCMYVFFFYIPHILFATVGLVWCAHLQEVPVMKKTQLE